MIYKTYIASHDVHEAKVFSRAEILFKTRKLNQAIQVLEKQLLNMDHGENFIRGKLLLASVILKKSQYTGDKQLLNTCKDTLEKALELSKLNNNEVLEFEAKLLLSQVCIHLEDYDAVNNYLRMAEHLAEELKVPSLSLKHKAVAVDINIRKNNFNKAYDLSMHAINGLQELEHEFKEEIQAEIYLSLVRIFIKKQDYKKSIEYNDAVLNYALKNNDLEKELMALNNMAIICSLQFEYRRAMEYLLDALVRSEEINFKAQIARCQINLGSIYAQLYNHEEATRKYEAVLNKFDDLLETSTKVVLFNNLGNIKFQQGEIDLALQNYSKSNVLANESNYKEMMPHTLAQISKCYLKKKDFQTAAVHTNEASKYYEEKPILSGWPIHLINEGILEQEKSNQFEAINKIKKSLQVARKRKDRNTEIEALAILAEMYKNDGDLDTAFEYLNQYVESSRNFELNKQSLQILDLEISFALKDKQNTIEQLIKDNEYKTLLLKQSEKIADQNEMLKEVNQELRQYAYITSHDLKEPLRMIKNFSGLVSKKYQTQLDTEGQEFLTYINEGAQRMDRLLDDLLRYTRIGSTEIEKTTVDLNEVLEIVQLHIKSRIEEHNAKIIAEKLPKVKSNQALLIQLIQNLLVNAIKFKKENEDPIIQISFSEDEFFYQISIKDNGIGIAKDQQDRVFVIFQKLHSKNTSEGTGIGLAICKKIAKKLDGELWLNSEEGQGSTFHFAIPKS